MSLIRRPAFSHSRLADRFADASHPSEKYAVTKQDPVAAARNVASSAGGEDFSRQRFSRRRISANVASDPRLRRPTFHGSVHGESNSIATGNIINRAT